MEEPSKAMSIAYTPTGTVATIALVETSIFETVLAGAEFKAHMYAPSKAIAYGLDNPLTVATTLFVRISILETLLEPAFTAHMYAPSNAMPRGVEPTVVVALPPVRVWFSRGTWNQRFR
jgi:hypothetical protein